MIMVSIVEYLKNERNYSLPVLWIRILEFAMIPFMPLVRSGNHEQNFRNKEYPWRREARKEALARGVEHLDIQLHVEQGRERCKSKAADVERQRRRRYRESKPLNPFTEVVGV